MKISGVPFTVTDWDRVPAVEHPGETGMSRWRTAEAGNVRVRVVEYSPGYRADHWCARGHVLWVIEGELTVELKNGALHHLKKGMSFQAADDDLNPHLAYTEIGAKVFLID
jgi:quercetin dioxygenase-like cupin family protein